jgi:fructose transport system substrate-binding protein
MRTSLLKWTVVFCLVPLALTACSSDDNTANPTTTGGGNAGSGNAGSGNAGSAGSGNAGSGNGGGGSGGASTDGGAIKVGLITKETGNPFFAKMKDGAQMEADAKGATLIAELGAADNASQVTTIDSQIAAGVKGILLVAADTTAIEPKIADIKSKNVLVIALDTPVSKGDTDALFATDNEAAGKLIGQYAKSALGTTKTPRIIALDGPDGLTVSDLRHNGFLEGFGIATDAGLAADGGAGVACKHATMGSEATGKDAATACLATVPDVNIIYTVNEPVAAGAYAALQMANIDPKNVIIVSVDGGCDGVQAVKDGKIAATAQQYPLKMAQLGVDAVLTFAQSGTKPAMYYTDTGVNLITDKAQAGVTSKDTVYGLANCWGMVTGAADAATADGATVDAATADAAHE